MKNLNTTLTLVLLLSGTLIAQEAAKPTSPVNEISKAKAEMPKPLSAKQPDIKKPVAEMKDMPAKPEEIKIKQTETKEIKPMPSAAKPAMPAPFYKKAEELQKNIQAFIEEAIKFADANPSEKEKILEQIGIIMGMSIAGLEAVSGEKIIDFDALAAAEEEAKRAAQTTKKVERPAAVQPEAKKPTSPQTMEKKTSTMIKN